METVRITWDAARLFKLYFHKQEVSNASFFISLAVTGSDIVYGFMVTLVVVMVDSSQILSSGSEREQ